jgi:hypothetical protein
MSEPLERDTLFKRLRSKPENKASQDERASTAAAAAATTAAGRCARSAT